MREETGDLDTRNNLEISTERTVEPEVVEPEVIDPEIIEPEAAGSDSYSYRVEPPSLWHRILSRVVVSLFLGMIGITLCALGAVLTITIIGATLGIPLILGGLFAIALALILFLGGGSPVGQFTGPCSNKGSPWLQSSRQSREHTGKTRGGFGGTVTRFRRL